MKEAELLSGETLSFLIANSGEYSRQSLIHLPDKVCYILAYSGILGYTNKKTQEATYVKKRNECIQA